MDGWVRLDHQTVARATVLVLDRIDVIDLVGHLAEDDDWVLDLTRGITWP